MLTLDDWTKGWSRIAALARSYRDWATGYSLELTCCDEEEVARMARDFRMSAPELRMVASRGPDSADLLPCRLAALDLDRNEIARTQGQTLQDLQRVCGMCDSRRRCARDLACDSAIRAWRDYCPNAATLMALDALSWAGRSAR